MSEEAIYKLHRYPSGELEEFEYVQELIRCKECKKWSDSDLLETHNRCDRTLKLTKTDDFCSYGERREP